MNPFENLMKAMDSFSREIYTHAILHINSGPYCAVEHRLITPDLQCYHPAYKVPGFLDQKSLNL
jgi:hypothetical protein